MQRLLSRKYKKSVRETIKNNAVFKSIKKAYKDFEVNMDYFQFSTEEIFINCFIELDRILKNRDDMTDIADTLWVDVFTELRDEAEDEDAFWLEFDWLLLAILAKLLEISEFLVGVQFGVPLVLSSTKATGSPLWNANAYVI